MWKLEFSTRLLETDKTTVDENHWFVDGTKFVKSAGGGFRVVALDCNVATCLLMSMFCFLTVCEASAQEICHMCDSMTCDSPVAVLRRTARRNASISRVVTN